MREPAAISLDGAFAAITLAFQCRPGKDDRIRAGLGWAGLFYCFAVRRIGGTREISMSRSVPVSAWAIALLQVITAQND